MRFPYAFIHQQAHFRIFAKFFTISNLSPYFTKVKIKLCIDEITVDHHVIKKNSGAEAVFRTMV